MSKPARLLFLVLVVAGVLTAATPASAQPKPDPDLERRVEAATERQVYKALCPEAGTKLRSLRYYREVDEVYMMLPYKMRRWPHEELRWELYGVDIPMDAKTYDAIRDLSCGPCRPEWGKGLMAKTDELSGDLKEEFKDDGKLRELPKLKMKAYARAVEREAPGELATYDDKPVPSPKPKPGACAAATMRAGFTPKPKRYS